MRKFAIFVATTGGAVQIERLTEERAPQSMICVSRSTTILPISKEYHDYVRRGSGIIEREFNYPGDTSFRADVSGIIDAGKSWQLAFYLAHAVTVSSNSSLVDDPDEADHIIWATGCVDYDLNILNVDHLAKKLDASTDLFDKLKKQNKTTTIFVPLEQRQNIEEHISQNDNIEIYAAEHVNDLLNHIRIDIDATPPKGLREDNEIAVSPKHSSKIWVIGFLMVIAAIAAWFSNEWFLLGTKNTDAVTIETENADKEINKSPKPKIDTKKIQKMTNKPLTTKQNNKNFTPGNISQNINVNLFALGPREGKTCIDVNFGGDTPIKKPFLLEKNGKLRKHDLRKSCRILFEFEPKQNKYIGVWLKKISGRYISIERKPDALSGSKLTKNQLAWTIELPKIMKQSFHYRVFVLSGNKSLSDNLKWLTNQANSATAEKELISKGIEAIKFDIKLTAGLQSVK